MKGTIDLMKRWGTFLLDLELNWKEKCNCLCLSPLSPGQNIWGTLRITVPLELVEKSVNIRPGYRITEDGIKRQVLCTTYTLVCVHTHECYRTRQCVCVWVRAGLCVCPHQGYTQLCGFGHTYESMRVCVRALAHVSVSRTSVCCLSISRSLWWKGQ